MKEAVEGYLKGLLGSFVEIEPITDSERKRIGLFASFYDMNAAAVGGRRHLFAFAKSGQRYTPHAVAKQFSLIRTAVELPLVFVPRELAPHDPSRLIAAKVPYVWANRSLYLPESGLAFSRSSQTTVLRETFSVPAQLFVCGYLLKKWSGRATISEVMNLTGYSFASVVHAFQEIEHFDAGERVREADGRTMCILLKPAHEIWSRCRNRFFNPCKRMVGVVAPPVGAVEAGVDALARISDLNEEAPTCFALALRDFRKTGTEELSAALAACKLQLWHYRPTVLGGDAIDPVSLWLSLQNDSDDRVQIQLNRLQEAFKW